MIDKLDFTFRHEINVAELYKYYQKISQSSQGLPDANYGKVTVFRLGGNKTLTIKSQPKMFAKAPVKILSNPSRFNNFSEYLQAVLPTRDSRTGIVHRIDFATDITVPLNELFLRTAVKYKQKTREFRENRGRVFQGFIVGTNNHQVIFYDKGLEIKKNGSLKPTKGAFKVGELSRVEVRLTGKPASEFGLSTFQKVKSYNPFSRIMIIDFLDNPYGEKLKRDSLVYGFHKTRAILNENNNFTKQYSRGFKISSINKQILEQHKQELEKFFKGEGNGDA